MPCRHLAALCVYMMPPCGVHQTMSAERFYNLALEAACNNKIRVTNVVRLGLALNTALFMDEIMHRPGDALRVAKDAFDLAMAEVTSLQVRARCYTAHLGVRARFGLVRCARYQLARCGPNWTDSRACVRMCATRTPSTATQPGSWRCWTTTSRSGATKWRTCPAWHWMTMAA